jgi:protein-tyrosine-phosphatase
VAGNLAKRSPGHKLPTAQVWPAVAALYANLSKGWRYLRDRSDSLLHSRRRRAALERLRRVHPRSVLFICHGNICRSPFAAALFRSLLPPDISLRITDESRGFIGGAGRSAPPAALMAAARRGVDLLAHRSALVTHEALHSSDLIVVVSDQQARALHSRVRSDTVLLVLGDLDPLPITQRTIADPWNRDAAEFDACFDRIDRCVRQLVQTLTSPNA